MFYRFMIHCSTLHGAPLFIFAMFLAGRVVGALFL